MGFSIPYDSSNYTEDENRILRMMIDAYNIELSHIYIEENNKNRESPKGVILC